MRLFSRTVLPVDAGALAVSARRMRTAPVLTGGAGLGGTGGWDMVWEKGKEAEKK
jgi:hypothetical protein